MTLPGGPCALPGTFAFSYRKKPRRDSGPVSTIRGDSGLPVSPRHHPATAGISARSAALQAERCGHPQGSGSKRCLSPALGARAVLLPSVMDL